MESRRAPPRRARDGASFDPSKFVVRRNSGCDPSVAACMNLATKTADGRAPGWLVWAALWTVYIVWGSTYLAIRVTVDTIPPLLSAAVRFLIAGSFLYGWLALRGGRAKIRIGQKELAAAAIVGTALLLGGNGIVSIAEQEVPSGLAALLIASVPLWVVVLRFFTGDKVPGGTLAGVIVGFVGVSVLILPGEETAGASIGGMLLLVLASMSWATGSFFSQRLPLPEEPLLSSAAQMLVGGALLTAAAALSGEFAGLELSQVSATSVLGLAYLIVAGTFAFIAYVWVLQNVPISKVATYAYVNPVIAIVLGWALLSEPITPLIVAGAALVVSSVAFIVRKESPEPRTTPEEIVERPPEPALALAQDAQRSG